MYGFNLNQQKNIRLYNVEVSGSLFLSWLPPQLCEIMLRFPCSLDPPSTKYIGLVSSLHF